ncbi:prolipoprotein diacylglyceryl transferase [Candidatus Raskinella chloraquaticus]|uniref:Phosphatidylglycerol--prolipoprotein diacylglyceryl transferase n=2 Tax=Candidatus Raskinella chloraquaticus TaxID=1951219 RepID=A0A1W9I560_9HYPH|nr:MAG: prolipoprotein diacylglyceryl transferase [Proteobacteria bacterium SG_bin8]
MEIAMPPLLALPFPAIDPVLIELGPFPVRWYALAYLAGLLLGWWLAQRLIARNDLFAASGPPKLAQLDDFLLWAAIGIVCGGRLGFVLFYNLDYYLENPLEIIQPWRGGMSFHGGAAGLMVATYLFARRQALPFLTLMDVVTAVAPVGLFFGRIANFINGELYGRVSDVPWAILFPRGGFLPRHPSQLYEAGLEGLVLFIVLMVLVFRVRALRWPGVIAGVFLAGYGVARSIVEFYREPDAQLGYLAGGLTMGQVLSLPMILCGVIIVIWAARRQARP